MFIRFIVSNYLSFKDETEFNMIADSFRNHNHHLYKAKTLKILKGSAIYGANGAGKSNLVKSIDFLKELVKNGEITQSINSKKFKLSTANINKPVNFEIEFYYKKKIYNYGIQLNEKIVENEWLYISGINSDDKLVFERKTTKNGKSKINFNKTLIKTQKDKLLIQLMEDNLLQENELLISKVKEINKIDLKNANEWIVNNLVIIYPQSKFSGLVPFLLDSVNFKKFTNSLLSTLKTGVNELDIKNMSFDSFFGIDDEDFKNELKDELKNGEKIIIPSDNEHILATNEGNNFIIKRIAALHYNNKKDKILFDLSDESNGTRRLLDFIPAFYGILKDDVTFIIDEIDQSIHPALLYDSIKKIMGDNTTKGQLIFTTHESNLLDFSIFRQDEIWFTEKDKESATGLYSLSEYKPRYDLDIRKGYLKGRFGAIPFTTELKKLNWDEYEEKERI
jgi:AAA15 family ATPase/GTPase